jgi:hypothetical protein
MYRRHLTRLLLPMCGAATLVFPALLGAQGLSQVALSTFPADTHQLSYTDLRQLRTSPDYPSIRARLLGQQLGGLAKFLGSAGDDPEKDADEVMLGWRGQVTDPAGFFGLASGHFQPDQVRAFFKRSALPVTDYSGVHLYSSGSGEDRSRLYFTFLNDSSAVFGRLADLKALLDVRAGLRPALDTQSSFVNWETELDGAAPQWGIASGKAAAGQAALWLTGGVKAPADLGALMAPVQAVLYTIELGSNFSTRISVVCDRPETAAALAQILLVWRNSQPAAGNSAPELAAFLASLNITASGPRVELDGSGPIQLIQQLGH